MADIASFPHGFDPTSSVLFLGAGFSREAENVAGGNPPLVSELETQLKRLAGLPDSEAGSVGDLAQYAMESGHDVYSLLRENYIIRRLNDHQKTVLAQPWLRIYTTNYDDAAEMHSASDLRVQRKSYNIGDDVPQQLRDGSIVHLHGYIHKCTPENVLSQIVLTHHSYAQQRAVQSPWWQAFERDLRISQNIFFVGYELNDFEPASYLTRNPTFVSKTHFILRPSSSTIGQSRLKGYGSRHSFAVQGFAAECKNAVVGQKPQHANALKGFKYLDINPDNKLASRPTQIEIQALFALGNYQQKRLLVTYPKADYIAPRRRKVSETLGKLAGVKTLILHSKIGNGKTLFRHGLSLDLALKQHACFEVRENVIPPAAEIEFIRNTPKAVVFFPNYDTAYAVSHLFTNLREDARFVVEIATSVLQVRNTEIFQRLPGPIERVDLNLLDKDDILEISELLDQAGIEPKGFRKKFRAGAEFRDIILSMFQESSIIDRIDGLMKPLISDVDMKLVLMCSAILKALGLSTDPGFLRAISRVDSYQVLSHAGEQVFEIVDFAHDRVEPHSALFSEFLLRRYLQPHELAGAVFTMAAEAARRKSDEANHQTQRSREARATLGALLRFSFLNDLLQDVPSRDEHIQLVYENGRYNEHIQTEPLFWLQYSIFMQSQGKLDLAERHMETAYKRAEASPGFLTYQIDTNSLGLVIELESQENSDTPVKRAGRLVELVEKVALVLADGNHRWHAIDVLGRLETLLQRRKAGLSRGDQVSLVYQLNLMTSFLENLPAPDKAYFGTESLRLSLLRSVQILTR